MAEDPDAIGGTNENHGGAVSEAARITCWETDGEGVADPNEEEEEADPHGTCVSEVARDKSAVGGKNGNHGGAVSEAARVTCRDGPDDPEETVESLDKPAVASDKAEEQAAKFAEQAAKASHAGGKPSWAGNDGAKDNGKGGGNGRGGGRP